MLRDPVTEFTYPDEWVARCADPRALDEVGAGRAVLTSHGQVLRRGYTTGTSAAAACKAAVLSHVMGLDRVEVTTNCGVRVSVQVTAGEGRAECRKYPGDYPSDVTAGARVVATVESSSEIEVVAGEGIGRFSRDTPLYQKGQAAISRSAMGCILRSIQEAVLAAGLPGARVHLEVMDGREIGLRTLNPRMGVEGGISILGTTGLVEPWDDHLEESNLERIAHADKVVLTTGRLGLRYSRLLFPEHEAVLVGVRMEKAIEAAKGEVVLCGLPALILKFIDPDILRTYGAGTVEELSLSSDWPKAVGTALAHSRRERPNLRVVLVDRQGTIVGDSE